jgi:hypothetical protein
LIGLSIPIMVRIYWPLWDHANPEVKPYHLLRYRWLGAELTVAVVRTSVLSAAAWCLARSIARMRNTSLRAALAGFLPLFVIADLLGAHIWDVPTIDPRYWTVPPESVERLRADPTFVRLFGVCDQSAGEPGYASRKVDYLAVRDTLDWSLPLVWRVRSSRGNTPMISRRLYDFERITGPGPWRHDLQSTTHILTGERQRRPGSTQVGSAYIERNPAALPRARLAGRPVYAESQEQAAATLGRLGADLRDHVVVEDPTRPLATDAPVTGTARITQDLPEHVVVETDAAMPSYLVLSDTFDPGWSATLAGQPVPIRPAYLAYRAVFLPAGKHAVEFRYRPAGFTLGAVLSACGVLLAIVLCFLPGHTRPLEPEHAVLGWPASWRIWWFSGLAAVVLVSIPIPIVATDRFGRPFKGADGRPVFVNRWSNSVHPFTWAAGIKAMER